MQLNIRNLLYECKNKSTALIKDDKRINYAKLSQLSMNISCNLSKLNDDKIVVFLPSNEHYIAAFFGVLMAGKAVFPINAQFTVSEVVPLVEFAEIKTIITNHTFKDYFTHLQSLLNYNLNILYIEDLLTKSNVTGFKLKKINRNQPMVLLSTSGTTGKAKIVSLSENNLEACVLGYLDKMDYHHYCGKKYILATPFTTAYGIMVILACVAIKYCLVILKEPFTITTLLKTASKHKVTFYEGGTPTILMLYLLSEKDPSLLIHYPKLFCFGGSKISGEMLNFLKKRNPTLEFHMGYGMTEASPLITKLNKRMNLEKTASVGEAIKGLTIKINSNNKLTTKPFVTGEIAVKGKNVMIGYLNNQEETNKIIKNGYLYTGDIGYFDKEKYLYVIGRKKNMVIIRGFNVYTEEVESVLSNCKLVKDCFIYSKQNALTDETLCADIIPVSKNVKKEDIINYCKNYLTDYKIPKDIHFVSHIRKTITGKNICKETKE